MAGKGRAPCCDKSKVKKGPWSPAEDTRLIAFIQKHGHSNWRALPKQAGLLRCGKSCRLRWINYLRPDVKRGSFTPEEEESIIRLQKSMGNKWSKIASQLPGRTDNEIKNVWNTHLKKKLGINDVTSDNQNQSKDSFKSNSSSSSTSSSSCISYGDQNQDIKGHEFQETDNDQKQGGKVTGEIMEEESHGHSNTASEVPGLTSMEEGSRPVMEDQTLMATDEGNQIDIPLMESDSDFWSMLDSFSPMSSSYEVQVQESAKVSTMEGTDYGEEDEYKKWLKYIENELGLGGGGTTDNDCCSTHMAGDEELVMKASEINPSMSYFSTWPSSPQDFGM